MAERRYTELLIGCGHSRDKRVVAFGTPATWQNLVTLDCNPDVDPDVLCNLDVTPWRGTTTKPPKTQTSFGDNSFDEVHAYEVLEHLGRQGDAAAFFAHFSEIWRILAPGGVLCATVPSQRSPWLWGDPSHRRAIQPESLVFLDQSEYIRQLDCDRPTPMSDFREIYAADFEPVHIQDTGTTFYFVLRAVKPSRNRPRAGKAAEPG